MTTWTIIATFGFGMFFGMILTVAYTHLLIQLDRMQASRNTRLLKNMIDAAEAEYPNQEDPATV